MGNVKSVQNALELLGESAVISDDIKIISESDAIVLPGVGSFSDGMKNLQRKNLLSLLDKEVIEKNKPYLGICLGLEFLVKQSTEGGIHSGFGWINGSVDKISPKNKTLKIPHMGWNDTIIKESTGLFKDMSDPTFYYLHSYMLNLDNSEKNIITSTCNYGDVIIPASIQKDNIFAVQFHPEKSQSTGIKLLKNFIETIK
jgi:glutamine amidotransferase